MPFRTYLWAVIMATISTAAAANPISVRSGAHDGFSRLVLRVPDGLSWTIDQDADRARLTIPGHSDGFDIGRVFDLIDGTYIESVTSDSDTLEIVFACDCVATTFTAETFFLAIDIATRPADSPLPDADEIWSSSQAPFLFPSALGSQADDQTIALPTNEAPAELPIRQTAPTPQSADVLSNRLEELTRSNTQEEPDQSSTAGTLAEARNALSSRIATAATRGVLQPTINIINIPVGSDRPQIDTAIFDPSTPPLEIEEPQLPEASINLRITSSSDVPLRQALSDQRSPTTGIQCLAADRVNVAAWGATDMPWERVSELRGNLFSDTDRLQTDVAVDLARLYLHYGFGAEARQIMLLDRDLAVSFPELIEIADIMEYTFAKDAVFLPRFADCDSDVALWSILAQSEMNRDMQINANAALRALNAQPMHLRQFVAPILSRRFLAHGDNNAADSALRTINRTAEPPTAAQSLARGELLLEEGQTDQAQAAFAEVVASNEQQSAEALIKFVDSHLAQDTSIDEDIATLVEAYAIEMRDDPLGADLKRAHVLALAKSQQFDEAFQALDRIRLRDGGVAARQLRSTLLGLSATTAPDVVFLEYAFGHAGLETNAIEPSVALRTAERLERLGFAQIADAYLRKPASLPNTTEARLVRARVALSLGQAEQAKLYLGDLEGVEASALRARASRQASRYAEAAELFREAGDQEASLTSSLLAEDWESLSQQEQSTLGSFASVVETPMDRSDDLDGMLQRMSNAVSESLSAREAIERLLDNSSQ